MEEDNDKTVIGKGPRYVPPHERGKGCEQDGQNWLAFGLGIGSAVGVAFGLAMNNLGLGIGVGVAIGAGIGTSLQAAKARKKDEGEEG